MARRKVTRPVPIGRSVLPVPDPTATTSAPSTVQSQPADISPTVAVNSDTSAPRRSNREHIPSSRVSTDGASSSSQTPQLKRRPAKKLPSKNQPSSKYSPIKFFSKEVRKRLILYGRAKLRYTAANSSSADTKRALRTALNDPPFVEEKAFHLRQEQKREHNYKYKRIGSFGQSKWDAKQRQRETDRNKKKRKRKKQDESDTDGDDGPTQSPVGTHGPSHAGAHGPTPDGAPRPSHAGAHGPTPDGAHGPSHGGAHGPTPDGAHGPSHAGAHGPTPDGAHGPSHAGAHGPTPDGAPRPSHAGAHGPTPDGAPGPSHVTPHASCLGSSSLTPDSSSESSVVRRGLRSSGRPPANCGIISTPTIDANTVKATVQRAVRSRDKRCEAKVATIHQQNLVLASENQLLAQKLKLVQMHLENVRQQQPQAPQPVAQPIAEQHQQQPQAVNYGSRVQPIPEQQPQTVNDGSRAQPIPEQQQQQQPQVLNSQHYLNTTSYPELAQQQQASLQHQLEDDAFEDPWYYTEPPFSPQLDATDDPMFPQLYDPSLVSFMDGMISGPNYDDSSDAIIGPRSSVPSSSTYMAPPTTGALPRVTTGVVPTTAGVPPDILMGPPLTGPSSATVVPTTAGVPAGILMGPPPTGPSSATVVPTTAGVPPDILMGPPLTGPSSATVVPTTAGVPPGILMGPPPTGPSSSKSTVVINKEDGSAKFELRNCRVVNNGGTLEYMIDTLDDIVNLEPNTSIVLSNGEQLQQTSVATQSPAQQPSTSQQQLQTEHNKDTPKSAARKLLRDNRISPNTALVSEIATGICAKSGIKSTLSKSKNQKKKRKLTSQLTQPSTSGLKSALSRSVGSDRRRELVTERTPRNDSLNPESVEKIREFFLRDDNSYVSPNKAEKSKDMRVMTDALSVLYERFMAENPVEEFGKTTFHKYMPSNVRPAKDSDHVKAGCKYHEDARMKLKSLREAHLTDQVDIELVVGRDLVCDPESPHCMLTEGTIADCATCHPRTSNFTMIAPRIDLDNPKQIRYKYWTNSNGYVEPLHTEPLDDTTVAESLLQDLTGKFPPHMYCAKKQYRAKRELLQTMPPGSLALQMDFSQKYATKSPNEIQSAFFTAPLITIHTIQCYYKASNTADVVKLSVAQCTDEQSQGTEVVFGLILELLNYLRDQLRWRINKVYYWTDGSAAQYKNRSFAALIVKHKQLFNCEAEIAYFATSHGKGPADGIGGTVKRMADRRVHQGKFISNAFDFVTELQASDSTIVFQYISTAVLASRGIEFKVVTAGVRAVVGIQKAHMITKVSEKEVRLSRFACYCSICLGAGICEERDQYSKIVKVFGGDKSSECEEECEDNFYIPFDCWFGGDDPMCDINNNIISTAPSSNPSNISASASSSGCAPASASALTGLKPCAVSLPRAFQPRPLANILDSSQLIPGQGVAAIWKDRVYLARVLKSPQESEVELEFGKAVTGSDFEFSMEVVDASLRDIYPTPIADILCCVNLKEKTAGRQSRIFVEGVDRERVDGYLALRKSK